MTQSVATPGTFVPFVADGLQGTSNVITPPDTATPLTVFTCIALEAQQESFLELRNPPRQAGLSAK